MWPLVVKASTTLLRSENIFNDGFPQTRLYYSSDASLSGHIKDFIWSIWWKTRDLILRTWISAVALWTWIWDKLQRHTEDVENRVQEADEETIPDGSTDAEEEFLRACSNGDKDLMKRFIARKVDVNTAEERSGNTGKWLLKDP